MHHVHLLIRGRVQGVGFRYFALREAGALGLAGRVCNCADGSVEVEAEGERSTLEQLVEWLRIGPRSAIVTSVDEDWDEGPSRHRGFQIGSERT